MEEEKVVVENEQVPADPAQEKNALMAFILSLVGLALCESAIGAIILGAISLNLNKKAAGIQKKPHAIFQRVSKPVAIVDIILGVIMCFVFIGLIIGAIVAAVAAAASGATAA